jgi:dTDP-4-amino-4,6-dideoxygalactose transaminase
MGQPAKIMYENRRAWTYHVRELGFRYHMSNVHAAIGLAQLKKMERISETRRATCRFYNAELKTCVDVITPRTDFIDITPFLYYIRVPAEIKEDLRDYMIENGVDVGIHWTPGHWFELFKHARRGDLSVTDRIAKEILSLPLHSSMAQRDAEKVVNTIRNFFSK